MWVLSGVGQGVHKAEMGELVVTGVFVCLHLHAAPQDVVTPVLSLWLSEGPHLVYRAGAVQNTASDFRRIPLPRTPVNGRDAMLRVPTPPGTV
jgi:hypothetical protein